jgi:hypothetical protein
VLTVAVLWQTQTGEKARQGNGRKFARGAFSPRGEFSPDCQYFLLGCSMADCMHVSGFSVFFSFIFFLFSGFERPAWRWPHGRPRGLVACGAGE